MKVNLAVIVATPKAGGGKTGGSGGVLTTRTDVQPLSDEGVAMDVRKGP